jgi:hypothetical protein
MSELPKRIHLLGSGRHEEGIAAGAIKPGMLIAITSAVTTPNTVTPHATSGGYAERNYALEDALQGRTIADAYKATEIVAFVSAEPGDVVYAWLNNGENVSSGDLLQSGGDGTLIKRTSGVAVAVALEAVHADDSVDDARIKARVL